MGLFDCQVVDVWMIYLRDFHYCIVILKKIRQINKEKKTYENKIKSDLGDEDIVTRETLMTDIQTADLSVVWVAINTARSIFFVHFLFLKFVICSMQMANLRCFH